MKVREDLIELGNRVKHIRKTLKLTQDELAKSINISVSQVSEVENAIHPPGYYFLVNIANIYNVNLHFLMFGQGGMFRGKVGINFGLEDPLVDHLVVKREIFQHFLGHLYRSQTLQHYMLAHFNSIMGKEAEQIDKEIREFNEKARSDSQTQTVES